MRLSISIPKPITKFAWVKKNIGPNSKKVLVGFISKEFTNNLIHVLSPLTQKSNPTSLEESWGDEGDLGEEKRLCTSSHDYSKVKDIFSHYICSYGIWMNILVFMLKYLCFQGRRVFLLFNLCNFSRKFRSKILGGDLSEANITNRVRDYKYFRVIFFYSLIYPCACFMIVYLTFHIIHPHTHFRKSFVSSQHHTKVKFEISLLNITRHYNKQPS